MGSSPQSVYAKCLPTHYGYPLWNPGPSNTLPLDHRQDGLQVGDVGIVDPDRGFDVLFNICKPHDHELHRPHGIPPSLHSPDSDYPISLNGSDVHVKSNDIPAGSVIMSNGVQERRQRKVILPKVHEFTVDSSEGGILILPRGATFHDLIPKDRFFDLARQGAVEWYQFATEKLHRRISNNSLYLITGFYKAPAWSLVSFHNAPPVKGGWSIQAIKVKDKDGSGSVNYRWKHQVHAVWKYWPQDGRNGRANQSVFLRGYKIALKERLFQTLQPAVHPIPLGDFPVQTSFCFSFPEWLLHRRDQRNLPKFTHTPALSPPFHYSDVINGYLLSQDPDADVAITHDSKWTTMLETGKLKPNDVIQEGYLVRVVSEEYSFGSCDGVVYWQDEGLCVDNAGNNYEPQEMSVVSVVSEPSYVHDDVRVVITNIRGDQLAGGPGQVPASCYVLVQSGTMKQRTKNKPIMAGEVTEWDDLILLPPESSAMLQISVCAKAEKEEILHTLELSVQKLLDEELIMFPLKGEDADVSACSSLLITMEHKDLNDLDDSPCFVESLHHLLFAPVSQVLCEPVSYRSHEELLVLAKAAEEDGRWEDLVKYMKDIVCSEPELTPEERNLFSVGYEKLTAPRRESWNALSEREEESKDDVAKLSSIQNDRQGLEHQIVDICNDVLDILNRHLIPSATSKSTESIIFYGQMVGEYFRHLSEVQIEDERKESIQKSLAAYQDAWTIAISELQAMHPIRLHLALNLSMFYYEVLHSPYSASRVAQQALEDIDSDELSGENYNNSMSAVQSLRDNVARWNMEVQEERKDGDFVEESQPLPESNPVVCGPQPTTSCPFSLATQKSDFDRSSTFSSSRNSPAPMILVGRSSSDNLSPNVVSTSFPAPESDVAPLSHLCSLDTSGSNILDNAGGRDATSSEHHDPINGNDIVIAVMGLTGAGKSSFINTAARRSEVVVTNDLTVKAVRCMHPDGRRNVVLVDTPGFDDTCLSDAQILRKIANWLKETYQDDIKLTGLLYLHRISDVRMAGTPLRNLSVFKDLCGNNNMKNIVLVTTMWDEVEDQSVGDEREAELLADFWKGMIRHGSRTCRYQGTRDSAWEIIKFLDLDELHQKRTRLQIQRVMLDRFLLLYAMTVANPLLGSAPNMQGWKKIWEKLLNKIRRKPTQASSGGPQLRPVLSRSSTIRSTSSGPLISAFPSSTAPPSATESIHSICSINSRQDTLMATIRILEVAHQMADLGGTPMLRGIIGTAMRIAQLIQEMGGVHHAITQVIESSGWLLNEVTQYATKSKLSKDMKRALSSLQRELTSLQTVVAKFPERNRIARFLLHDAEIQTITACTTSINAVYEKLEVKLAIDNRQAIARLEDQLKALYNISAPRQCERGVLTAALAGDESLEARCPSVPSGGLLLRPVLSRSPTIRSTSSGTSIFTSPDSIVPTTPTGSAYSICSINGCQDMLSVAIRVLGVAHQMADISGIPMLRGVIGTAMRIAQLIQEMGGIHHAIAQVIESTGWLLNEVAQYATKSRLSRDMKRALGSLQRALTSLQTVIAKFPERNRITRFLLHDADIQAISACTAAINAVYEKLEVKLAMDNRQTIARLEDQLKELYNISALRRRECGTSTMACDEPLEASTSMSQSGI